MSMGTGRSGRRFVFGMVVVLSVFAGLLALSGVPAAVEIFCGLAGLAVGVILALVLVPRRGVGTVGRALLALLAAGGIVIGGPVLSVFDFHTLWGLLSLGLYFGFCAEAVYRLTLPTNLQGSR